MSASTVNFGTHQNSGAGWNSEYERLYVLGPDPSL